jgi:hypothetical protein
VGVAVTLPGGAWRAGARVQSVELDRPGASDAALLEALGVGTPAARATALLARCVARLGPQDRVQVDDVRALGAGDREALLLHLRRLLVGERIECLVDCPHDGCRACLEVAPEVADLLLDPYADWPEWHECTLAASGRDLRVRFRVPTGLDQELAARVAVAGDVEAAARLVADRCVQHVEDADTGEAVGSFSDGALEALAAAMGDADPQAEIVLGLTCPECEGRFDAPLDVSGLLFAELDRRVRALDWEVHLLASRYHWSERDILALHPSRRRRYLDLLDATAVAGA